MAKPELEFEAADMMVMMAGSKNISILLSELHEGILMLRALRDVAQLRPAAGYNSVAINDAIKVSITAAEAIGVVVKAFAQRDVDDNVPEAIELQQVVDAMLADLKTKTNAENWQPDGS